MFINNLQEDILYTEFHETFDLLKNVCNMLTHIEILTVFSNVEDIANIFCQNLQSQCFIQFHKPIDEI